MHSRVILFLKRVGGFSVESLLQLIAFAEASHEKQFSCLPKIARPDILVCSVNQRTLLPRSFIRRYNLPHYFLLHWSGRRSLAAFRVLVHCRTINKLTCSVLDWAKSYHLSWRRSWLDANGDPEIRRIVQITQPLCTHLKADEGRQQTRQRCVVVVATETVFCT
ncbi:hypothetical protein MUK42_34169 [Musa troglodytarum]|uniref:Uncharacterized protein n=1 Tax=Musa troglodytarum TaxID=320322 RepID=A0A9E7EGV8_9LILI|nr:hypothetical protein MUK42_34169 [Musa troglodytarum]